jgi:hypothetical protein
MKSPALGAALAMLFTATLARGVLEQSMAAHMLLQLPLLFAAGAFSSVAARSKLTAQVDAARGYNAYGIAGLLLASGVVACWMVPRALDAAVEQRTWEVCKVLSLAVAGALAERSWQRAHVMVRAFVVGNSLWMSATVGLLLIDAPNRLCANYTTNDQGVTGFALVGLSIGVSAIAAVIGGRRLADAV